MKPDGRLVLMSFPIDFSLKWKLHFAKLPFQNCWQSHDKCNYIMHVVLPVPGAVSVPEKKKRKKVVSRVSTSSHFVTLVPDQIITTSCNNRITYSFHTQEILKFSRVLISPTEAAALQA